MDVAPIPPATIAAHTSAAARRGRRRPTITALDAIRMTSDAFEAIARGGLVIRAAARGLPSPDRHLAANLGEEVHMPTTLLIQNPSKPKGVDLALCKRLAQDSCRRASAAESWATLFSVA